MKKLLFFFLLFQGTVWSLKAQTNSLEADGTAWQYVFTSLSSFNVYRNVVEGDTLVNGRRYKKIYSYGQYGSQEKDLCCVFRQEGDKIFALPSQVNSYLPVVEGEVLLYDFSLSEGDKFNGRYKVEKVDSIKVGGKWSKRIAFDFFDTWVEGIGSLERAFGGPLEEFPTDGSRTKLEVFEQNSEVLYGTRRFALLTDGVHWKERISTEDGPEAEVISPYFQLEEFSVKGDTVIGEGVYKQITRNGYPFMSLRQSGTGKIYYYTETGDRLLYDFGWKRSSGRPLGYENDKGQEAAFRIKGGYYGDLEDGHCYEYVQVEYEPFTYYSHTQDIRLYMGMGLTSGIFTHLYRGDLDCYCYKDLVVMYDAGNKLIYQNPLFDENGELSASIVAVERPTDLTVTDRGAEVEFTEGDLSWGKAKELVIYDIAGRVWSVLSMERGRVVVSGLPQGIYVYRCEGKNGRFIKK